MVPIAELLVDQEVKEAFMGKPILSLRDGVAFWHSAGYDFICLFPAKDMFEKSFPLENYRAMIESAFRYGRYPISF